MPTRALARRAALGASPPSPAVALIAAGLLGVVAFAVYLPHFSPLAEGRRHSLAAGDAAPPAKVAPGSYWRAVTASRDGAAAAARPALAAAATSGAPGANGPRPPAALA